MKNQTIQKEGSRPNASPQSHSRGQGEELVHAEGTTHGLVGAPLALCVPELALEQERVERFR